MRGFVTGLKADNLRQIAWSLHNNWDRLEDHPISPAQYRDRFGVDEATTEPAAVIDALDRAVTLAGWCTAEDDLLLRHVLDVAADARQRLQDAGADEQAVLAELNNLPTAPMPKRPAGELGRARQPRCAPPAKKPRRPGRRVLERCPAGSAGGGGAASGRLRAGRSRCAARRGIHHVP